MFGMWWMSPYDGPVETLRLIHSPWRGGLGVYEDAEGARWDVKAIKGDTVCARRLADHPGFYSTAGSVENVRGITANLPSPIHEWLPYKVEIVGEEAAE